MDKFQFSVVRKDWFSTLTSVFGMRATQTGFPQFDQSFLVKSTDPDKVKQLFQSALLRELLAQHRRADFWLSVITKLGAYYMPPKAYMLQYEALGAYQKLQDTEYLSHLVEMSTEILDQLLSIGSAEEITPPSFIYPP